MLIIVKLPFQAPDPIGEYERTLYKGMGEYKERVIVPEMLIKLKQGFGRLIRTETDNGVVAILDSRARQGGAYRESVLNALPDCRITTEVSDIKQFIKDKKEPGYFKVAPRSANGKEHINNGKKTDSERY
jgi:ATP-dependent DNA helicase DinG